MKLGLIAAAMLAASVAVGCSTSSDSTGSNEAFATSDIDRMFKRADGKWDVWCSNGTKEEGVTAAQINSNQLCGGGPAPATPGTSTPPPAALTPTNTTNAELLFRNVKRTAERAQFGIDQSPDGNTFHIEAHEGGEAKCPDAQTPSPKRTMIVTGVKTSTAAGTKLTEADGIAASFLDFTGDQVSDKPFLKATAITVTVVASSETGVEIEVDATFGTEGTAKGRLAAAFCQSLSAAPEAPQP